MLKFIEQLEARVKELETFLSQSLSNHHGIVGRLEEARVILGFAQSMINDGESIAKALEPAQEAQPENHDAAQEG